MLKILRDELFDNNLEYVEEWGHSWYGIETVPEFLEKETLRSEVKDKIKEKQWVLSYSVTNFELIVPNLGAVASNIYKYVKHSEVSVLQLNFSSDGVVYDIGVVDDKITSDPYPVNWNKGNGNTKRSFWDKVTDFFNKIGAFFARLGDGISKNLYWILIVVLTSFMRVFFSPMRLHWTLPTIFRKAI